MVECQWDDAPEEWPKLSGYPCVCGLLCESFSCCAIAPLFCGSRTESFTICCDVKEVCICKKPFSEKNILGYHVEGDCALTYPEVKILSRAQQCCIDVRCQLPPSDEQPCLCGLHPIFMALGPMP